MLRINIFASKIRYENHFLLILFVGFKNSLKNARIHCFPRILAEKRIIESVYFGRAPERDGKRRLASGIIAKLKTHKHVH